MIGTVQVIEEGEHSIPELDSDWLLLGATSDVALASASAEGFRTRVVRQRWSSEFKRKLPRVRLELIGAKSH